MRINELFEAIDQKEADEVLRSVVATGDSVTARYFMQTRYDPRHTSIDSAQRAAERMAKKEQDRSSTSNPAPITTKQQTPLSAPKAKKDEPKAKDFEPAADKDSFKFDPDFIKNFKPFSGFTKAFKAGSALANKFYK